MGSSQGGCLPLSCRRVIVTLLPKKDDLQDLKNWRLVSQLCGEYKILSKALALRLREVMAGVIHVDQTYCVPSRLISEYVTLIWHVLEVSSSLAIDTGLISIDQEKVMTGLNTSTCGERSVCSGSAHFLHPASRYHDFTSILKINGGLAAPFAVQRGV